MDAHALSPAPTAPPIPLVSTPEAGEAMNQHLPPLREPNKKSLAEKDQKTRKKTDAIITQPLSETKRLPEADQPLADEAGKTKPEYDEKAYFPESGRKLHGVQDVTAVDQRSTEVTLTNSAAFDQNTTQHQRNDSTAAQVANSEAASLESRQFRAAQSNIIARPKLEAEAKAAAANVASVAALLEADESMQLAAGTSLEIENKRLQDIITKQTETINSLMARLEASTPRSASLPLPILSHSRDNASGDSQSISSRTSHRPLLPLSSPSREMLRDLDSDDLCLLAKVKVCLTLTREFLGA